MQITITLEDALIHKFMAICAVHADGLKMPAILTNKEGLSTVLEAALIHTLQSKISEATTQMDNMQKMCYQDTLRDLTNPT